MARKVVGDRRFYPVDVKAILRDDNIDAALAHLKGIEDESAELLLDIPKTIKEGVKQGGLFLPHEMEKINEESYEDETLQSISKNNSGLKYQNK